MVELITIFLKTIHRAEIVPLAVMPADDSIFIGYVDTADRVAVCLLGGIPVLWSFFQRFFWGGQRENNPVADVQQQAPYQ